MQKTELPAHLIIIGAGYIGLELGQAYRRLGTRVSIVEQQAQLGVPQRSSPVLQQALETEGIEFFLLSKVQRVTYHDGEFTIAFEHNGKNQVLRGSHLLVATGRKPNTEKLALENAGIATLPSGHIQVNEFLQTSRPHIYAAGDCINTPPLVYTAAYEGKVAVDNIVQPGSVRADYTGLLFVVFTDPQVAYCGTLETNEHVEASELSMDEVPACLASQQTVGFIRLLRDRRTDLLIGAEIVGPHAGETIIPISIAIRQQIPLRAIRDGFFPYLTYGEAFKLAAIAFEKDIHQLSCCAS